MSSNRMFFSKTMDAKKKTKYLSSERKCCIKKCRKSKSQFKDLKIFKFPDSDKILGQIWREKCKIPEKDYTKNLYICEKHFDSTFVGKKKLKTEAIPTIDLDEIEEDSEDIEFQDSPINTECENVDAPFCKNCKKHTRLTDLYRKKYNGLLKKYKKLKSKKLKKSNSKNSFRISENRLTNSIDSLQNVSKESKTFCKLLLSSRPKGYSEDVKYLAQNIYYKSQSTYLFLRNKLNLNLPHISTLNRWAPIKFLQPGLKNNAFETLKLKCAQLDEKNSQHMVLVMDEMSIRKELRYNQSLDLVDGFETTGTERTNRIASHVCVFMIKSMFSSWSILLNYFVSQNGLSADTLTEIIKENIILLKSIGIKICALVCDQGPTNRKCFSNLKVSAETPFFELNGQKVFCMYDFPHLIKSLRNGWLKCDLKTPDGTVSFQVIQEIYEMEINAKTKMCPKLTRQHIYPNTFEKMRVKFATQVFSRTVAATIKTMVETSKFKTISAEVASSTAQFVEKIDKIFDCLNSCTLYGDNCYRSAVQLNNESHKFIQEFLEYLEKVEFIDQGKRVFFLNGMKLTLNSVLLLVDEVLKEGGDLYFVMTKYLNQDKLENTFSVMRQKGGNNNNPSVAELNNILAKIMVAKIIQSSSSSNCELLQNETMEIDTSFEADLSIEPINIHDDKYPLIEEKETSYNQINEVNFDSHIYADYFLEDVFENSAAINFELGSMRYFVGYVAFKVIPKLECTKCSNELKKMDEVLSAPSELFIFFKNYQSLTDFGNLNAPSDKLMDASKKHILVFHKIFTEEPQRIGIKSCIIESCKRSTPEWFVDDCSPHKLEILDFMLLVLLRKHCSWAIEKGSSKQRKTKILSNK